MDNKTKLRALIEANRIARLPRDKQNDYIDKFETLKRKKNGKDKERLEFMIDTIVQKQIQEDEAYENMTYADYGGGYDNGGGGSGTDNG